MLSGTGGFNPSCVNLVNAGQFINDGARAPNYFYYCFQSFFLAPLKQLFPVVSLREKLQLALLGPIDNIHCLKCGLNCDGWWHRFPLIEK